MDDSEIVIMIFSSMPLGLLSFFWYWLIYKNWPKERGHYIKLSYKALPLVMCLIILIVLLTMASYDVVNSPIYISLYIFLGLSWIALSALLIAPLFDISWRFDGLNMNNSSAALTFVSAIVGLTIIYAGANIGDGPGWWCVLFAYLLGMAAWFILMMTFNKITSVSELITVDRDFSCAIRVSCFFISSALIFARASAGDWTSAYMTIVEFQAGWPVVCLFILSIIVELFFKKSKPKNNENFNAISVVIGLIYMSMAILIITYIVPLY